MFRTRKPSPATLPRASHAVARHPPMPSDDGWEPLVLTRSSLSVFCVVLAVSLALLETCVCPQVTEGFFQCFFLEAFLFCLSHVDLQSTWS